MQDSAYVIVNVVSVGLGQGTAEENSVLVTVHPHIRFRVTPGFRWLLLYRWPKEWTVKAKISGCRGISDNRFQTPGNRQTSTVVHVTRVNVKPIKMWAFITLLEILVPGFVCVCVCVYIYIYIYICVFRMPPA